VSKGEGRTVLFVSHNMGAVKNLCNSSIFLNNGSVNFRGEVNSGILKYYSSNSGYLESKEIGIFDFKNHVNKKNTQFGILKAELYCNNILTDKIISGSNVKIKLYYNSYRDLYESEIGIVIKDYENNNYIGLNNKHLGIDFNINEGEGSAEIIINNFPIYGNSEFFFNLYFGDKGPDYEILENAIKFNLIGEDSFCSGRQLPYEFNKILSKNINIKLL
jgi:lipopolysaccharide transport system ATP-binding protein